MKKIVVFGGGTGLSCLLSGLKLFPVDVTAVITVTDNGSSTGQLKKELDIPAVGDIGKVLISMANVEEDFIKLLGYRFKKESFLENHPVRNILLAALIDIKGNLTDATKYMCKLLNIKGTILPLTEEKVELVGYAADGSEYFGELEVTKNAKSITSLKYDHDVIIREELIDKIQNADLIIFSPGSLFTSILPHLVVDEVKCAINHAKCPKMYVSNLVTQPGETDNYSVSDHIKLINKYLEKSKVDVVIANNKKIDKKLLNKYSETENKKQVKLDSNKIEKLGASIIEDRIYLEDDKYIRHDPLKTAYLIFSYLMDGE